MESIFEFVILVENVLVMINYDCFDVFIELYLTLVLLLLNILLKVSFLGEWISIMCKKN